MNILVYVNEIPVYVKPNTTVIQACEKAGRIIPRFCYHDLLEIAGNCRICLVEIEKSPKPMVACGLPVLDNIRIYTDTPLVLKAREGVLEFLLLNHPLDCPICDQGGECDLQNQVLIYGSTKSRYYIFKRSVEDKGLGPIIKTVISRCIHCTRCVRFAWEIAGVEDLGTTLRGSHTEIGTYLKKTFNSEVSGNIIDLCPVGALTSKVDAFKTRPWEVQRTQSVDISDSLGSNIIIESKRDCPIRIVPKPNKKINEDWLSDKGRFTYEGFTSLRLKYPYFSKKNKLYRFSSLLKTKKSLENFLKKVPHLTFVLGRNLNLETIEQAIIISKKLGIDIHSETTFNIVPTIPAYIQGNLNLSHIQNIDVCLLIGVNPRLEGTILNLRLRNRFKKGLFKVLNLGCPVDLTYKTSSCSLQLSQIYKSLLGKVTISLVQIKKSIFIYGDTLSMRNDAFSGLILTCFFQKLKRIQNWNGCIRLPRGCNSIGKAFYGLSSPILENYTDKKIKTTYILGLEDSKKIIKNTNPKTEQFIVESTHVNTIYKKSKFVYPLQTVYEKDGSLINYSGLIQKTSSVLRFGHKPLIYLEATSKKKGWSPNFKSIFDSFSSTELEKSKKEFILKINTTPLKALLGDIYRTDQSTKASRTLAKLSGISRKVYFSFLHVR